MIRVEGKPNTITQNEEEEERTEVLRNPEEEQTKPATRGTGIPYDANPSPSSTNTTLPNVKSFQYQNHENNVQKSEIEFAGLMRALRK